MHSSSTTSDSATWSFTGSNIALLYTSQPNNGIANVLVDGAYSHTVDMYSASAKYKAQETIATGLGPGSHSIAVSVMG